MAGYPINKDFNGANQHGVGFYQVTQKNGRRFSAADAYISPILNRDNLTVMLKTQALKLNFSGKRCIGVSVRQSKSDLELKATKEVILSAGAFGSPKLLLLSGIGSARELKQHGIKMIHELSGVGQNLQDHPDYVLSYNANHKDLLGFSPSAVWDICKAYLKYRKSRTGMMSSNFTEAGGFIKSAQNIIRPDLQLHFMPGIIDQHLHKIHFKRGMSCHVCVLRPKSRGELRLRSSDPFHKPLINPNFLAEQDDVELLLKGIIKTREILEQDPLKKYREKELFIKSLDPQHLIELIRSRTDTVYHPVGTCRMGLDEMSVVDPQLRVYGVEGLRVADASVMPNLISGNTNAPSMMIGEQAAKFIKNN